MPDRTVATTEGQVTGTGHGGCLRFAGIPYAAPPVGPLRFRAPQPPIPHAGVLAATTPPQHAPQLPSALEGFLGEGVPMVPSEAGCLALTVWTPSLDGRRPVLFFVHGGGYAIGTSASSMYDATGLATEHDVVVVSCNYRLGVLGFTHVGAAGGAAFAGSGSAGVLDVVAALRWVRDNVAGFGGDPGNVTVFGESAGAMTIGTMLGLPSASGLFHKAILESGAAGAWATAEDADAEFDELAALLGTRDVAAMQAVPVERLLEVQQVLTERSSALDRLRFRPVVDGAVLPSDPLSAVASGAAATVPLLIGTNRDEWRLFSALDPAFASMDDATALAAIDARVPGDAGVAVATYRKRLGEVPMRTVLECVLTDAAFRAPAIQLAEAQQRAGGDAWCYLLTWASPAFDGVLGSCHAIELPLVFNTIDAPSSQLFLGGAEPRELSRRIQATWAAFARHGDPGRGAFGEWPRYDPGRRATMLLDDRPELADDPLGEERALWG